MTLESFDTWWVSLDPVFVFLLALPFAVAAAGLVRLTLDHCRSGRQG